MNYIFDINYVNNAWSHAHRGTLIMPNGSIRQYDFSDMKDRHISLNRKIRNSRNAGTLSANAISNLSQLANNVRQQPLRDFGNASDAGTTTFSMYDTYNKRETILGYGGDHTQINPSAARLIIYLVEITNTNSFPGLDQIRDSIRRRRRRSPSPPRYPSPRRYWHRDDRYHDRDYRDHNRDHDRDHDRDRDGDHDRDYDRDRDRNRNRTMMITQIVPRQNQQNDNTTMETFCSYGQQNNDPLDQYFQTTF